MGFHQHARRVRDEAVPLTHRRMALKACLGSYAFLVRQPYRSIYPRFAEAFAITDAVPPSAGPLLAALVALEAERRAFLARLGQFAQRRVQQKRDGRRSPSRAELEALYRPTFFFDA